MGVIEVNNNYSTLGINSRQITEGAEFDMVQSFIDYKKESFKPSAHKELAIFIETKINGAYPDVVFAEYNPVAFEKWNTQRNKLTTFDLKILHFILTKRNVTSQRIVKELSIQYRTLLQSLEALMDSGLLARNNSCWVVPNRKDAFGVKHIEAVEAKISKWDEVMQQAILNKAFASESFVLSKRKRKPDDEVVKKIRSFGIGIYLYDDKQFSRYTDARCNRFPANYNSIYLNECIGRILNS